MPPTDRPRRRAGRARAALAVLGPAALGLLLASIDLSTRSMWIDESATWSIASQHGAALWAAMRHDGGNMLGYYALVHLLIGWFGDSVLVMRLPSVVATGLTAAATAGIGLRLFDRAVGAVAGVLAAVSLPVVYWGQDARAYAFLVAFVACSVLGFVALVTGDSRRHPGRPPGWAWWLFTGGLVLAIYMSFIAVLVVPAELVALVWCRRRLRPVVAGLVAAGLLALPVLALAHARGSGQLFWITKPSWSTTVPIVETLLSGGVASNFEPGVVGVALIALTVVALLGAGWFGLARARQFGLGTRDSARLFAGALVAGWLVLPFVLVLVESIVGQSIYEVRYLLFSLPAVALLLAWVCVRGVPGRVTGVVVLALLIVGRAALVLPAYGVSPENWRAATDYVLERATAADCVAFDANDGRMAFDYYLRAARHPLSETPRPVMPAIPFSRVVPVVEEYATLAPARIAALPSSCARLFVVVGHVGSASGTAESRTHVRAYQRFAEEVSAAYPREVQASFGTATLVTVDEYEP